MKNERLVSLDALRGFTMFWIIGGGSLIHALAGSTNWQVFEVLSNQMNHASWNGFRFLDLIFPLFMFISGIAIPFSVGRSLEKGVGRKKLLLKVAKRAAILILFGVIYNNKLSFDLPNLRYASVLGQIGVSYFIATCIYLYTKPRGQVIWLVSILLGFWAVMTLVPVPDIGAGVLTPEGNFSGYIDRMFLPGVTYRKYYDPQGILLMISAATITMAGLFAGKFIKNEKLTDNRKVLLMISSGLLLVAVSIIWNIWYPINKEIWSSSFNVLTIGVSTILIALFYYIIDVKGFKKWSFPFILIGLNPITIYMAARVFNFRYTADFFMTGFMELSGDYSKVVLSAGVIVLELLFLYFL